MSELNEFGLVSQSFEADFRGEKVTIKCKAMNGNRHLAYFVFDGMEFQGEFESPPGWTNNKLRRHVRADAFAVLNEYIPLDEEA